MDVCVIFYPGAYCQLQVADDGDDFCHVYDNPGNLAKDVSKLLGGDNAIGWYGNDPDAWLDPDETGGIRHISGSDLAQYVFDFGNGKIDPASLWENEAAFYTALLANRSGW